MNIVQVIPISSGLPAERLTYFSGKTLEPGAIVLVEVRKQSIPAVVVEVAPANLHKTALRQSSFRPKKLGPILQPHFFSRPFLRAIEVTANFFLVPPGAIVETIIPINLILNQKNLVGPEIKKKQSEKNNFPSERSALQQPRSERITFYKGLIRSEFARGRSVFLCLPIGVAVERWQANLSKGIEEYTHPFAGASASTKLLERAKRAISERHPILIIGTPRFLGLPRTDLGTIIVENEASPYYKLTRRPYLDIRRLAEELAIAHGWQLVFGDTILRAETRQRLETGGLIPGAAIKQRLFSPVTAEIIQSPPPVGKTTPAISGPVAEIIERGRQAGERIFILAARRGLAPITTCDDCGRLVACQHCQAPMVLHPARETKPGEERQNFFLCHQCEERRPAKEACRYCSSWRLRPRGRGASEVVTEAKQRWPDSPIYEVSSDATTTTRQVSTVMTQFQKTGGLLVGTELAMAFLNQSPAISLVLGLDSLFTVPDFRLNEKIFHLLSIIREETEQRLVIETRNPDQPIFRHLVSGLLGEFEREELAARKTFGYPPFTLLVKVSLTGSRDLVETEMKKFDSQFAEWKPDIFDAWGGDRNK